MFLQNLVKQVERTLEPRVSRENGPHSLVGPFQPYSSSHRGPFQAPQGAEQELLHLRVIAIESITSNVG